MELQGEFSPREDVACLIQFVKEHLANPDIPFYLCIPNHILPIHCILFHSVLYFIDITPPVQRLEKGSFESLGIVPSAVVFFALEKGRIPYLLLFCLFLVPPLPRADIRWYSHINESNQLFKVGTHCNHEISAPAGTTNNRASGHYHY